MDGAQKRQSAAGSGRPRIAVFAGPNATVLNSEPLVTSNKARERAGLAPRTADDGTPLRFDPLRLQRLAAPVTVYVEQFSAHPLESDAAELYGPPDGYVDAAGAFHAERSAPEDRPVFAVTLRPDDGLYPLPYMALQADGRAWEGYETDPFGPPERARQPFYPDPSRLFEEIDRLAPGDDGLGSHLQRMADYDFVRAAPPGGYTKAGEVRGRDYFPYRPVHLIRQPSRRALARLTNIVSRTLADGSHLGSLWLEGSPYVEETAWWLGLLVDTTTPFAACASQRPHGGVGNDGDRNIIDAVRYLTSRAWDDGSGRDAIGSVVVMDQQIVSARSMQKADARPGGYVQSGFQAGVVGTISSINTVFVGMRPTLRHTWSSDVRLTVLPESVAAIDGSRLAVRDGNGDLLPDAIPPVWLVKHGQYAEDTEVVEPAAEVALLAIIERARSQYRLGGIVAEGSAPYGSFNEAAEAVLQRAAFSGIPVVKVGRGNAGGFTEGRYAPFGVAGGDHTATKARLLLMAALLKLGALPPAADPDHPTAAERQATRTALDRYQEIFDRH